MEMLRRQIAVLSFDDFSFGASDSRKIVMTLLDSLYVSTIYIGVRSKIMVSTDGSVPWNASVDGVIQSYVGLLKFYTAYPATTLKKNALVACPVHIMFLNMSTEIRSSMIDNGPSSQGFLTVQFDNTNFCYHIYISMP